MFERTYESTCKANTEAHAKNNTNANAYFKNEQKSTPCDLNPKP